MGVRGRGMDFARPPAMHRYDSWTTTTARRLRREATDAERRIWAQLRRSKAQHWRRQCSVLGYFLDFYSRRALLAVELDGGQRFEPAVAKADLRRDEMLGRFGVRVLRYDDALVMTRTEDVVEEIRRIWTERAASAVKHE